jgi:hypothetical protein
MTKNNNQTNYACILIIPDYPQNLAKNNTNLVGYVIDTNDKVVNTAIITRDALPNWFESRRCLFSPLKHRFLVGSIALVGEVVDSYSLTDRKNSGDPPILS